jgi:hypothetical protein
MKRCAFLYLLCLVAGAAGAEHWFMVQAPVSVSVDTASIEILPAGLRRARVKLDMSLVPPGKDEPPNRLLSTISVTIFDCKKQASRIESGESQLADGTVKEWHRSNPQEVWLHTDNDIALWYVCAWPGPSQ